MSIVEYRSAPLNYATISPFMTRPYRQAEKYYGEFVSASIFGKDGWVIRTAYLNDNDERLYVGERRTAKWHKEASND